MPIRQPHRWTCSAVFRLQSTVRYLHCIVKGEIHFFRMRFIATIWRKKANVQPTHASFVQGQRERSSALFAKQPLQVDTPNPPNKGTAKLERSVRNPQLTYRFSIDKFREGINNQQNNFALPSFFVSWAKTRENEKKKFAKFHSWWLQLHLRQRMQKRFRGVLCAAAHVAVSKEYLNISYLWNTDSVE